MKKLFCLAALLLSVAVSSQAQQSALRLNQSSDQAVSLTLNPSDLSVKTVVFAGDTFSRIEMPEFAPSFEVGRPELPIMSKLIEVPVGARIKVNVLSETHRIIAGSELGLDYRCLPAQPARRKSDTSNPVLSIDALTYSTNAFYGQKLVRIEEVGVARDRRLANVIFSPVQYNPVTNEVLLYSDVRIEIVFEGGDIAATAQLKKTHGSGAFGAGINTINTLPSTKDLMQNVPIRYTIISHHSFRGELDTLISWKKRKGFLVDVHYTDEIGADTGSIATFLRAQYSGATAENPAPTYVLLVGDHQQIPAFRGRNTMQSDWSGGRISDLYYFTWTTGDYVPDCYYGRFSAQTVAQLTPQIEKTLYYEQYRFLDPAFLGKALIVAGTDRGSAGDNAYTCGDPTMDYIVKNYVNGDHGYTQVSYYKNQYTSAPTAPNVTTYSNGGYNASNSSNSTSIAVRSAISEGRGWINYSAHGNWDEWSIPAFNTSHISSLSNTKKFGIMIGNCCLTNSFQQSECFGEALLRRGNYQGAVAYIGASDYTYWYQDYYFGVGYRSSVANPTYSNLHLGSYDRLFHTHNESFAKWATTTGSMMYAGNMAVQESGESNMVHYYWEVYHIMGDPSIQPWLGQAQAMTVSCPSALSFMASSLDIAAVPYAYVAVTSNGEVVTAMFADQNGQASFPMSQLGIGDYEVAISAQNYQTAFRQISIVPGDGPYVMGSNLSVENGLQAGRVATFAIDLRNVGNDMAHLVDIVLEGDNDYVTPVRNHTQAVNMGPDYGLTLNNAFAFLVRGDVSDQTRVHFTATITWDNSTDNSVVEVMIPVDAPVFQSSVSAPSNATVGTPISISVSNTNAGHVDAVNVVSTLICGNPNITISNPTNTVETLDSQASFSDNYTITINSNFTGNHIVPFYHKVSDGLRETIDTIEIVISDGGNESMVSAFEDFETGNFNTFPWSTPNGTTGWSVSTDSPYAGTYCAKSGNAGIQSSESTLSLQYTSTLNDSIRFFYKVSSENNYDFFRFYIDGEEMVSASGRTAPWTRVAYFVPAGTHSFVWKYSKDYSQDSGDDCARIDNITFPRAIAVDTYVFDTICSGTSYSHNGHSFETASLSDGTYYFEYAEVGGGIVYISLTIGLDLQVSDDVTIERGEPVVLIASGAERYEWSDGQTGASITVAPGQTTTYTVTGHRGSCSEQASVTITVNEPTTGIENASAEHVDIYPNPAADMVNISATSMRSVRVLNALGQVVLDMPAHGSHAHIDMRHLASGMYLIQIEHQSGETTMHKLVRK